MTSCVSFYCLLFCITVFNMGCSAAVPLMAIGGTEGNDCAAILLFSLSSQRRITLAPRVSWWSYHTGPRRCRPDSPSPRHTGSSPGCSVCLRHSSASSRPPAAGSWPRPIGPGTDVVRHTPPSGGCTSCRGRTGTGLWRTGWVSRGEVPTL